jgi:ankyrin repeat protein
MMTILSEAVISGNIDRIKELLNDENININEVVNYPITTPFYFNPITFIDRLIYKSEDRTALRYAIEVNQIEIAKLLINHPKIEINAGLQKKHTMLHIAIIRKDYLLGIGKEDQNYLEKMAELITELLKKIDKNEVYQPDEYSKNSPLDDAINRNYIDIVKILIDNTNPTDNDLYNAVRVSMSKNNVTTNSEARKVLIDKMSLRTLEEDREDILAELIKNQPLRFVIEDKIEKEKNSKHIQSLSEVVNVLDFIIEAKRKMMDEESLFFHVLFSGNAKDANLAFQAIGGIDKIKPSAKDRDGNNVLQLAIRIGACDIVEALVNSEEFNITLGSELMSKIILAATKTANEKIAKSVLSKSVVKTILMNNERLLLKLFESVATTGIINENYTPGSEKKK